MSHSLTSDQLRAARAILKIDQIGLAEKSGVSVETIKRIERTEGPLKAQHGTLYDLRTTLEKLGIEFLYDDEGKDAGIRRVKDHERRVMELAKAAFLTAASFSILDVSEKEGLLAGDPEETARRIYKDAEFLAVRNLAEVLRNARKPGP